MFSNSLSRLALCAVLASGLFGVSCNRLSKPTDDAITTDIKSKMFSDPALKSASVGVSSNDGVVTLTGQVPDEATRQAADNIASASGGVKQVIDQMSVAATQTAMPNMPADNRNYAAPERPARTRNATPRSPSSRREESAGNRTETSNHSMPAALPAAPPAPRPVTVTIPVNTIITILTIDGIDSTVNKTGQTFAASLDAPIVVDDAVVIPKGANANLKLISASSAGRMTGRSELTLALDSLVFQGKTYEVVSSDVKQSGASRGKRTAETVGGGAVLGALIGGLAGGGKGAAIGAAVGGGAGAGVQGLTHGQQIKVPSETRLDFTLQQPVDVTYFPGRKSHRDSSAAPSPSADQPPQR
ncbi:MAG: hypothetical protein PVS2B2_13520 [Candidatus Acidiferrum sp.]